MPDGPSAMMAPPSGRRLKKATSKDEDLMASLEMMESLAADLPMNNLSLGDKSSVSDRNGVFSRVFLQPFCIQFCLKQYFFRQIANVMLKEKSHFFGFFLNDVSFSMIRI